MGDAMLAKSRHPERAHVQKGAQTGPTGRAQKKGLQTGSMESGMKAVVCVHGWPPEQDFDWIRQAMEVVIVGHTEKRSIGESRPWLQWIVDNYDVLPNRVFFSHGHQSSWHCDHNISDIVQLQAPVTMLSPLTFNGTYPYTGLNRFHEALFNSSWQSWYNDHDIGNRRCCSESFVNAESIRKTDRRVYQELLATMETKSWPWGWVWENTWQSLFETGPTRSTDEVIKALQEMPDEVGLTQNWTRLHQQALSAYQTVLPVNATNS